MRLRSFFQPGDRIAVPPEDRAIIDRPSLTMEDYSDFVRQFLRRQYYRLLKRVQQHLVATPDARILDIGTGPGWAAIWLGKELPASDILGIDLSEDMLRVAQANCKASRIANVRFQQMDIEQPLPFLDHFQVIMSNGALQHFANPVAALGNIRQGLASGGTALICDLRRDLSLWGLLSSSILQQASSLRGGIYRQMADGWRYAVAHAYTCAEALNLARQAGFAKPECIEDLTAYTLILKRM